MKDKMIGWLIALYAVCILAVVSFWGFVIWWMKELLERL